MKKILIFLFTFLILGYNAFADTIDVYCPVDNQFLFTLDFEPPLTLDDVSKDISLMCVLHDAPINGWEYWAWIRHMEAPRMAYPALTVWTLKDDGTFGWFPHEVDVSGG